MTPGKIVLVVVGVVVAVLLAGGLFFTNFYSSLGNTD